MNSSISRKQFLRVTAFTAVAVAAGCTPLRFAAKLYPRRFREDSDLADGVLRAFVDAVIPGVDINQPDLVRAFSDGRFPFRGYRAFFASHLDAASLKRFAVPFALATRRQRTELIKLGLRGGAIEARLYRGAIFLAQVSVYAAIYDDANGCPLIDFHGARGSAGYSAAGAVAICNTCPLANEQTTDGNPN